MVLQALGISHSKLSSLQILPLYVLFLMSICGQAYPLMNHFRRLRTSCKQKLALFIKMTAPFISIIMVAVAVAFIIYPLYNKQSKESVLRLVIAIFAPLIKVIPHICNAHPFFTLFMASFSASPCTRMLKTRRICLDIELCQLKENQLT